MVASIRYWLRVFKICEGDQPLWFGNYLFDETTGKDKYLEKDKQKANALEKKISELLSGDNNVDVCTLLAILNKKLK